MVWVFYTFLYLKKIFCIVIKNQHYFVTKKYKNFLRLKNKFFTAISYFLASLFMSWSIKEVKRIKKIVLTQFKII